MREKKPKRKRHVRCIHFKRCTTTSTSPSFPQLVNCTVIVFSRLPISPHSSPPLFYPSLRRCFPNPSKPPILRSVRAISTVDSIEPIQISRWHLVVAFGLASWVLREDG